MAVSWQYRNNDGKFVDFMKRDSALLEKSWAKHEPSTTLAFKGETYTVDLKRFVQTNDATKRERIIRRVDTNKKTGAVDRVWGRGPVWEWEKSAGVFVPYDTATSDLIEDAFSKDAIRAHIKLDISAHDTRDFVVHFGHMSQQNSDGSTTRRVRRVVKDIEPPVTVSSADEDAGDSVMARQAALMAAASKASERKRPRDDPDGALKDELPSVAVMCSDSKPAEISGDFAFSNSEPLVGKLPQTSDWIMHGTVMVLPVQYTGTKGDAAAKIAGFDMDDTLVMPPSGATFAKSRTDWKWLAPTVVPKLLELHGKGYRIVIFSNQSGIGNKGWDESKASAIRGKIVDLSAACKIPIGACVATKEDEYRKPCTAMWLDVYAKHCTTAGKIDMGHSFYCGDAAGRTIITLAGRKKDFSCSDRKFAYNLGVKFFTPEELFNGTPSAPFHWDGLGPSDLNTVARCYPKAAYHAGSQELVLLVGFPGCGKSTFYHRFFAPHGYMHVNRDTLKTPEKCLTAASTYLSQKKSVVVDNTNPTAEDRAKYVALAKKMSIPVRCFLMGHDAALANHMNIMRARLGISARVSSIAYNVFKSKFEAPSAKEGFTEVVTVPPVAEFSGLPPQAKEFFYQLS